MRSLKLFNEVQLCFPIADTASPFQQVKSSFFDSTFFLGKITESQNNGS